MAQITLTNIGFILAIISVLFGMVSIVLAGLSIYFIKVNIDAIKNQNENAIRSEVNERFKNAIDQLGNKNNAVALGGIYTLHRVAKEYESYRENVFNILCSYVRDVTITDDYKAKYEEKPSEPIQTILNILCINEDDFKIYKEYQIDFKGANLTRAYLMYANLRDADLLYVNLTSARLENSNLINARLVNADLTDAYLSDANLTGVNLTYADLTNAILEYTNLRSAYLEQVDLEGAYLDETDLKGADCLGGLDYASVFENRIINGVGRLTDLSGIKGGYDKGNPPFDGKPIDGIYNKDEAKQMIEEYKRSLE